MTSFITLRALGALLLFAAGRALLAFSETAQACPEPGRRAAEVK
jgi:hypothetical protein